MAGLNLLHLAHQVYTYNEVCYTQTQVDTPTVIFLYHLSRTPSNRNQRMRRTNREKWYLVSTSTYTRKLQFDQSALVFQLEVTFCSAHGDVMFFVPRPKSLQSS